MKSVVLVNKLYQNLKDISAQSEIFYLSFGLSYELNCINKVNIGEYIISFKNKQAKYACFNACINDCSFART
jgi:hypothetical protein